jgi:hypothetical protein
MKEGRVIPPLLLLITMVYRRLSGNYVRVKCEIDSHINHFNKSNVRIVGIITIHSCILLFTNSLKEKKSFHTGLRHC